LSSQNLKALITALAFICGIYLVIYKKRPGSKPTVFEYFFRWIVLLIVYFLIDMFLNTNIFKFLLGMFSGMFQYYGPPIG
jgi:uncharacterized membrane protein YoaK (UPF0700 family)